ncbi:MAG: glycosyltransferase [Vicinamibacterales bacterium]
MTSVIVLVHDNVAVSAQCLTALGDALRGRRAEVVCVDNASTDDLEPLVRAAGALERFRFVRNEANLSFSVANNRAVALAEGDRLLFLNNDVALARSTFEAMHLALDAPGMAVVGARLLFPHPRCVQHAGMVAMLWGLASNYGVGASVDDRRFHGVRSRFAVTGAALMTTRVWFERLGGFDETYHYGYEDVDLCLAARAAGGEVVCVGDGESTHHESLTLRAHRTPTALSHNYATYRRKWDAWLLPRERAALDELCRDGVRRVAIFGHGEAGRALAGVLASAGIETAAFVTTQSVAADAHADGHPVLPISEAPRLDIDRLVVGSQWYWQVESTLQALPLRRPPLFPEVG